MWRTSVLPASVPLPASPCGRQARTLLRGPRHKRVKSVFYTSTLILHANTALLLKLRSSCFLLPESPLRAYCTSWKYAFGTLYLLPPTRIVLSGTQTSFSGTHIVPLRAHFVLPGAQIVLSGTQIVLSGTRIVLSGTGIVRSGTRIVLAGTQIVSPGIPIALSGTHTVLIVFSYAKFMFSGQAMTRLSSAGGMELTACNL